MSRFRRRAGDMELTMAIADWIREHTARQRVKFEAQMRQEAYDRRERLAMQAFIEGYLKGYDDSSEGRERRFPVDALDDPYKKYKID